MTAPTQREVDLAVAVVDEFDLHGKVKPHGAIHIAAYREELLAEFEKHAAALEAQERRWRAAGLKSFCCCPTEKERAAGLRHVINRLRGEASKGGGNHG